MQAADTTGARLRLLRNPFGNLQCTASAVRVTRVEMVLVLVRHTYRKPTAWECIFDHCIESCLECSSTEVETSSARGGLQWREALVIAVHYTRLCDSKQSARQAAASQ